MFTDRELQISLTFFYAMLNMYVHICLYEEL